MKKGSMAVCLVLSLFSSARTFSLAPAHTICTSQRQRLGCTIVAKSGESDSKGNGDLGSFLEKMKPKQYEPDEKTGMSSPFDFGAIIRGIQKGLGDLGNSAPDPAANAASKADGEVKEGDQEA